MHMIIQMEMLISFPTDKMTYHKDTMHDHQRIVVIVGRAASFVDLQLAGTQPWNIPKHQLRHAIADNSNLVTTYPSGYAPTTRFPEWRLLETMPALLLSN